jgi:hypothetical protein
MEAPANSPRRSAPPVPGNDAGLNAAIEMPAAWAATAATLLHILCAGPYDRSGMDLRYASLPVFSGDLSQRRVAADQIVRGVNMSWNRSVRRTVLRLRLGPATISVALGLVVAGCGSQRAELQVQVTQLGPYTHAAKAPDCQMPVLDQMPVKNLSEVAIVEVWADSKDQPPDVLPALQRKACETGADALVVINSQHQDVKNLLYKASPNQTLTSVTEHQAYASGADYIKEAEHTRRIGEAGHNGFYVDAVAIEYLAAEERPTIRGKPATVIDSIPTPHG